MQTPNNLVSFKTISNDLYFNDQDYCVYTIYENGDILDVYPRSDIKGIKKYVPISFDSMGVNVDNPLEKITALLNQRQPFYNQAHHVIDTDSLTPQEVVAAIISLIQQNRPQ